MALSGSFYNYPVKSFGLYCEWSASQSVTGNYSNVTLKVYLSYWDLYVGARDDGVINIAGNSSNFSTAAISESSSGWKKKLIAQKTVTVYHDGNGNAPPLHFSPIFACNSGGFGGPVLSQGLFFTQLSDSFA